MKVLPSTSSRRAPRARAMNNGRPPTALKARTGLSTPPGRIRSAREKRFRDFERRIFTRTQKDKGHKGREVTLTEQGSSLSVLGVLCGRSARALRDCPCGVARVVRDDDVRAGAPNGRQRLEHRPALVEPAV